MICATLLQADLIDRGGAGPRAAVHADRGGRAADQEIRVRILAAEDGLQLRDLALPRERIEIMRHRHEVRLRRQLVERVAPVGVGENAELPRFDQLLDATLHVGEIAGRGARVARDRLRERRGRLRIGLERRHHVHPVERVQVIEMHDVIVHELRADHQIADQLRIGGNRDISRRLRPRAPRRCRGPACTRRRCAARKPRHRADRGPAE